MTAAPEERRRVAVIGIDNFARKNRGQLAGLNARGYAFDVFTNDALGDSAENIPPGNRLFRLAAGGIRRTHQIASYLWSTRRMLHHVEVYPAGRFAAVYVALARIFRVPVMTVERGDLLYRTRYGRLTRFSMDICYRHADVVWYREPYQGRALEGMDVRRRFFLGNAVATPPGRREIQAASRPVDFAWVNRLIPERRADWVVDVLARPAFSVARAVMYGFMDDAPAAVRARQDAVRSRRLPNLELGAYADPAGVYRTARFFLLPSEIVFCNHALLEAMAHGLVPLVSDVEGARLIVEDGVSGFVFPHSPPGLEAAMTRALALAPEKYARMSSAAVEKVTREFSVERWCERLEEQYRQLLARPG